MPFALRPAWKRESFQRLGLDSMSLVEMVLDLEEFTGQSLEASIVLEYSCIEDLSANIARMQVAPQKHSHAHA